MSNLCLDYLKKNPLRKTQDMAFFFESLSYPHSSNKNPMGKKIEEHVYEHATKTHLNPVGKIRIKLVWHMLIIVSL